MPGLPVRSMLPILGVWTQNGGTDVLLLTSIWLPALFTRALAQRLDEPAEWLEARLEPIFDPAVRHILQALTVVQPESRTVIQLPFKL